MYVGPFTYACQPGGQASGQASGQSSGQGSCLLFDTDALRWRVYGVVVAVQFVQLIFVLLLYCAVKRRRFLYEDHQLVLPENHVAEARPPDSEGRATEAAEATSDQLDLVEITSRTPAQTDTASDEK